MRYWVISGCAVAMAGIVGATAPARAADAVKSQPTELLTAPIEKPPAPARPTKAELEAKLGRPLGHPPSGHLAPIKPIAAAAIDPARIQALTEDLARRRARNEQAQSGEGERAS